MQFHVITLFPENFGSYGWIYGMFGIIALAPTLLVYAVVSFFDSRNDVEIKQISKVDRISNRIAWALIIGCAFIWVVSVTGFFDQF